MGSQSSGGSQTEGDSPAENDPRYRPRHGASPAKAPRPALPPAKDPRPALPPAKDPRPATPPARDPRPDPPPAGNPRPGLAPTREQSTINGVPRGRVDLHRDADYRGPRPGKPTRADLPRVTSAPLTERRDARQIPRLTPEVEDAHRRRQLEGLSALSLLSQSTAATGGFPMISSTLEARPPRGLQAPASTEGRRGARVLNILRDPALRNAMALAISALLAGGLGLVFWARTAHYQSPATVGHVSAEVSAISFLAIIGGLNLTTAFPRFLPLAGWHTRRMLLASYAASASVGLIAVGIFMLTPLSSGLVLDGTAGRLAFTLCVVINSIFNFQDGGLVGFGKATWVPVENLLVAIMRLGLIAVIAKSAFYSASAGILWSWALPMGISVLVVSILSAGPLAARQAKIPPNLPPVRGLLNWVGIEAVTTIVNASVTAFLPALVTWRLGDVQGAYFFVPWTIAIMATLLLTNVFISMVREVITAPERAAVTIGRSIRLVAIVTVVGVLCCTVLAKLVLLPLGPGYATYGASFLRWIGFSFPASAINLLFVAVCLVKIRPGFIFVANCVVMIGTIGGLMTLGHGSSIAMVGAIFCGVQWIVAAASAIPAVRGIRAIIRDPNAQAA
jgi:O-antigen/teichoic acid export membrane protein